MVEQMVEPMREERVKEKSYALLRLTQCTETTDVNVRRPMSRGGQVGLGGGCYD